MAAALPVAIALTPILVFYLARFLGMPGVWTFEAVCLAAFAFTFRPRELLRLPKIAWTVALAWALIGFAAVADVSLGARLYLSTAIYDHYLRTAITDAITRTGIPPLNPQYFLGHGAPLRYHYFWFALCSLASRVTGNARDAVNASVVTAGLGLIALTALFARRIRPFHAAGSARLAVTLLAVTGLDLIPVILRLPRHIDPDMEWWNEPVYSWIGAVTWAPHYIAALIAAFTGLLLVWNAAQARPRACIVQTIAAGFAFASCAGLNIYLALAFAASCAVWIALALWQRWYRPALALAAAGVAAAVLAAPYLLALTSTGGSAGPLLTPAVRDFYPIHRFLSAVSAPWLNLIALPLNYALELGFFALILVWKLARIVRQRRLTPRDSVIAVFAAIPLALAAFLRSGPPGGNNDFGNIAPLIAQFVLLFWGADFLAARRRVPPRRFPSALRRAAAFLIAAGICGSLYELAIDRFYFPLADAGIVPPVLDSGREMAARAYAARQIYHALDRLTPQQSVFETNPRRTFDDVFFGLYAHRQMAAASMDCGAAFGGDPATCRAQIGPIAAFFDGASNRQELAPALDRAGIGVLVVSSTDPVWRNPATGPWLPSAPISNHFYRAFINPRAIPYN